MTGAICRVSDRLQADISSDTLVSHTSCAEYICNHDLESALFYYRSQNSPADGSGSEAVSSRRFLDVCGDDILSLNFRRFEIMARWPSGYG